MISGANFSKTKATATLLNNSPRCNRGLTLLELMITVSVAAITLSFALPSLINSVQRGRQVAEINDLITGVLLARSHAITHNEYVLLCPSSNGNTCEPSSHWQGTWVLLTSPTPLESSVDFASAQLLRSQRINPQMTLASNRQRYAFRPFGLRATNGTITFCDAQGRSPGKAVIISYNGRARVSPTLPDGGPIICQVR